MFFFCVWTTLRIVIKTIFYLKVIKEYCRFKLKYFLTNFFSKKYLKDDNKLLRAEEQFKGIGVNNETQKDGVSYGIYVIEVNISSF